MLSVHSVYQSYRPRYHSTVNKILNVTRLGTGPGRRRRGSDGGDRRSRKGQRAVALRVGHPVVLRARQHAHTVHVFRRAGLQRRVLGHQPVRAGHRADRPGPGHQVLRARQPHHDADDAARVRRNARDGQRGHRLDGRSHGGHVAPSRGRRRGHDDCLVRFHTHYTPPPPPYDHFHPSTSIE